METLKVLKRTVTILTTIVSMMIFAPQAFPQSARQTPNQIEAVIRQFWEGLGSFDADKIKQSADWPVTIVEASPSGATRTTVLRSPQEVDEEFTKVVSDAARRKGKSEFYGTQLLLFRVQMLNPNLASVSYRYQLLRDIADATPRGKVPGRNALAVLRRDPERGNRWRIVFTTVAK